MAKGELHDLVTRAVRDEDHGSAGMRDEDWWFELAEAFIAECRVNPPPRLLADLGYAPVLEERAINSRMTFKGRMKRAA